MLMSLLRSVLVSPVLVPQRASSERRQRGIIHGLPRVNTPRFLPGSVFQSVLKEFLGVDWKTEQFAELLFGDYLNREDKVRPFHTYVGKSGT